MVIKILTRKVSYHKGDHAMNAKSYQSLLKFI